LANIILGKEPGVWPPTLKFEPSLDFLTSHLPIKFHYPVFNRSCLCLQTNKQTKRFCRKHSPGSATLRQWKNIAESSKQNINNGKQPDFTRLGLSLTESLTYEYIAGAMKQTEVKVLSHRMRCRMHCIALRRRAAMPCVAVQHRIRCERTLVVFHAISRSTLALTSNTTYWKFVWFMPIKQHTLISSD